MPQLHKSTVVGQSLAVAFSELWSRLIAEKLAIFKMKSADDFNKKKRPRKLFEAIFDVFTKSLYYIYIRPPEATSDLSPTSSRILYSQFPPKRTARKWTLHRCVALDNPCDNYQITFQITYYTNLFAIQPLISEEKNRIQCQMFIYVHSIEYHDVTTAHSKSNQLSKHLWHKHEISKKICFLSEALRLPEISKITVISKLRNSIAEPERSATEL